MANFNYPKKMSAKLKSRSVWCKEKKTQKKEWALLQIMVTIIGDFMYSKIWHKNEPYFLSQSVLSNISKAFLKYGIIQPTYFGFI